MSEHTHTHIHKSRHVHAHTHVCIQNASEPTTQKTFSTRSLSRDLKRQGNRRKPGSGTCPESSCAHTYCLWQWTPSGAAIGCCLGHQGGQGLRQSSSGWGSSRGLSVGEERVPYRGSGSLCQDKDGKVSLSPQTGSLGVMTRVVRSLQAGSLGVMTRAVRSLQMGSLGVMTRAVRKAGRLSDRRQITGSHVPWGHLVLPS